MSNLLFERANEVAADRADSALRHIVSTTISPTETGDVESPVGWVAKIEITREDIATYATTQGDPWVTERRNFEPGHYLVRINNDGLIWGYRYLGEADAERDFQEVAAEYSRWLDDYDAHR